MKLVISAVIGLVLGCCLTSAFFHFENQQEKEYLLAQAHLYSGVKALSYLEYLEAERYDELKDMISVRIAAFYHNYGAYEASGKNTKSFYLLKEEINEMRKHSEVLDTKITNKIVDSTPGS